MLFPCVFHTIILLRGGALRPAGQGPPLYEPRVPSVSHRSAPRCNAAHRVATQRTALQRSYVETHHVSDHTFNDNYQRFQCHGEYPSNTVDLAGVLGLRYTGVAWWHACHNHLLATIAYNHSYKPSLLPCATGVTANPSDDVGTNAEVYHAPSHACAQTHTRTCMSAHARTRMEVRRASVTVGMRVHRRARWHATRTRICVRSLACM
jgi:hypothetical protein